MVITDGAWDEDDDVRCRWEVVLNREVKREFILRGNSSTNPFVVQQIRATKDKQEKVAKETRRANVKIKNKKKHRSDRERA